MKSPENNFTFESVYNLGIWKSNINREILNLNELVDKVYHYQNYFPNSVIKSNRNNGYQSEDNLHLEANFFPLVNYLNKISYKITSYPNFKVNSLWANISSQGSWNELHTHGSNIELLSGVLYLKVPPNSGDIIFKNPLNINHSTRITPIEGDIILFPQSFPHSVEPNLSQENRISIAFNYE